MKISVCIPMYNEEKIISDTIARLGAYMAENFEDYEIIFSDDGSTDNCRGIVEAASDEHIRAVGCDVNKGKGAAVRNGVLNADGDVIIFTDCDLAYGPHVIKTAVEKFVSEPDTDIVVGSRNLDKSGYDGYTFTRKIASKAYIKCLALVAGFKLTDSQCGFKAFRKETAHAVFKTCEVNGFAFDFEVLIKANKLGAKIREMPVRVINHHTSKVNVLRDSIKMLRDVGKIKKQLKKG